MEYLKLSNVELALLLMLADSPKLSGYAINRLIEQRGYRAWAGIGTSSIYAGLKKIETRGLAVSAPDDKKSGRGPRGQVFTLTSQGQDHVRKAVEVGLSTTREHDARFNLALCGIHLLKTDRAAACLEARTVFLSDTQSSLIQTLKTQEETLDFGAKLLFERIIHGIGAELHWMKSVLKELQP